MITKFSLKLKVKFLLKATGLMVLNRINMETEQLILKREEK